MNITQFVLLTTCCMNMECIFTARCSKRGTCYSNSVHFSVRHSRGLCENGLTYLHKTFTVVSVGES